MRAAALLAACAGLVVAAGACGQDPDRPRTGGVQVLDLPTEAQKEADQKLHEAEVFLGAGRQRLAEPLLRRVLELQPGQVKASGMLARCLIARGQVKEAAPLLERALAVAPQNQALRALHVQALMNLGDFAAAESAAREWTKTAPDGADPWFELGRALYRLARFEDAIQVFRRAETLKASRADIRSELGLALAAAGQLARAEAKQRDAIDRQPEYAEAWFRLGDVIFRRDPARAAQAVEALARAVELEPGNVLAHLYLFRTARLAKVEDGSPLRQRGDEAWKAVVRLHGRVQLAAALADGAEADAKASEFALREQVTLHPDDREIRLALARHLHSERRWVEAIDAYHRAIELGAGDSVTHVRLAAALVAHGEFEAAEKQLTAASASSAGSAGDAVVHRLRAWTLLALGRDADAIAAAESALAAAPGDVLAKKLLALARMHTGDVDAGLNEIAGLGWL